MIIIIKKQKTKFICEYDFCLLSCVFPFTHGNQKVVGFSPLISSAKPYSRRSTRLGTDDAEQRVFFIVMCVEKVLEPFRCHFRWNIPVNPAFKRRRAENANCVVCDRCSL